MEKILLLLILTVNLFAANLIYKQDFESSNWSNDFTWTTNKVSRVNNKNYEGSYCLRGNLYEGATDPILGYVGSHLPLTQWIPRSASGSHYYKCDSILSANNKIYVRYWMRFDNVNWLGTAPSSGIPSAGVFKYTYILDSVKTSGAYYFGRNVFAYNGSWPDWYSNYGSTDTLTWKWGTYYGEVRRSIYFDSTNWPNINPDGKWKKVEIYINTVQSQQHFVRFKTAGEGWHSWPKASNRGITTDISNGIIAVPDSFKFIGLQPFILNNNQIDLSTSNAPVEYPCGWQIDNIEIWDDSLPPDTSLITSLPYTCSVKNKVYNIVRNLTCASGDAITISADSITILGHENTITFGTTDSSNCFKLGGAVRKLTLDSINTTQGRYGKRTFYNNNTNAGNFLMNGCIVNSIHNSYSVLNFTNLTGQTNNLKIMNCSLYVNVDKLTLAHGINIGCDAGASVIGEIKKVAIWMGDSIWQGRSSAIVIQSRLGVITIDSNRIYLHNAYQGEGIRIDNGCHKVVHGNSIYMYPHNCRGIFFDEDADSNIAYNNYIYMNTNPNPPAGQSASNSYAFRVRFGSDSNYVHNNTVVAVGGNSNCLSIGGIEVPPRISPKRNFIYRNNFTSNFGCVQIYDGTLDTTLFKNNKYTMTTTNPPIWGNYNDTLTWGTKGVVFEGDTFNYSGQYAVDINSAYYGHPLNPTIFRNTTLSQSKINGTYGTDYIQEVFFDSVNALQLMSSPGAMMAPYLVTNTYSRAYASWLLFGYMDTLSYNVLTNFIDSTTVRGKRSTILKFYSHSLPDSSAGIYAKLNSLYCTINRWSNGQVWSTVPAYSPRGYYWPILIKAPLNDTVAIDTLSTRFRVVVDSIINGGN